MIRVPRYLLEKFFDIREGELRRALSMQLNIFLIITVLLILKPSINALFISTYGIEQLPVAFILVAVFAGLVTSFYAKVAESFSFNVIHQGTLLSSFLFLLFFGTTLHLGWYSEWILYAFYIWLSIFALLTTSQFWLLANQVFHARELKRLVGFIGAGAIAGGIFGGYLTSVLLKYLATENLPFVAAILLFLLFPLNWYIRQGIKQVDGPSQDPAKTKTEGEHPLGLIAKSNHLKYLSAIVAISVIAAKFIDYQFSAVASAILTDKDELTAFFGIWFSTFNVVSLILQLLATRFLLDRLGVGGTLLILPLLIVGIGFAMIFGPEILALVIMLKMADGSLKQSVNRSGMELLILPIPHVVKNKAKPFIDVFIDSVATGFSGILLLAIINSTKETGIVISAIITLLGLLWSFLVLGIKKEYLEAFRKKIANQVSPTKLSKIFAGRKAILATCEEALSAPNHLDIIRALQHIKTVKSRELIPTVRNLLSHPQSEVRWEAIQFLQIYRDQKSYYEVRKLINDPDQKVQIAAFAYLVERTPLKDTADIIEHLDSENSKLSGIALVSLAGMIRRNQRLQRKYDFRQRINRRLNEAESIENKEQRNLSKIYSIKAIADARLQSHYPVLVAHFNDRSETVARQAILATSTIKHPYFVEALLLLSPHPKLRQAAKGVLVRYGSAIIPAVQNLLKHSNKIKANHLRVVPELVKDYHKSSAGRKLLCRLASLRDPDLRKNALSALMQIKDHLPRQFFKRKFFWKLLSAFLLDYKQSKISYQILMQEIQAAEKEPVKVAGGRLLDLIQQYRSKRLEHIFILLSLRHRIGDISTILSGLRSRKEKVRKTSLEYLENLLDRRTKTMVIPLLEQSKEIEDLAFQENRTFSTAELQDCLVNLLNGTGILRLQLAILHYMNVSDRMAYQHIFEMYSQNEDPELGNFARALIEKSDGASGKLFARRS